MAALFRILAGIAAQSAWQRSGRRGPMPPVNLPGRRGGPLPIPSPWQMMMATWIAERLWQAYGPEVKGRLAQNPSPVAQKVNDFLPGPTATVAPQPTITSAPTPATPVPATPATPSTPAPTQAVTSTPAPAKKYATQRLPDSDDEQLPPGSVLQSLRSSQ